MRLHRNKKPRSGLLASLLGARTLRSGLLALLLGATPGRGQPTVTTPPAGRRLRAPGEPPVGASVCGETKPPGVGRALRLGSLNGNPGLCDRNALRNTETMQADDTTCLGLPKGGRMALSGPGQPWSLISGESIFWRFFCQRYARQSRPWHMLVIRCTRLVLENGPRKDDHEILCLARLGLGQGGTPPAVPQQPCRFQKKTQKYPPKLVFRRPSLREL